MPFSSMLGKSLAVLTANRLNARHPLTQLVDVGPGLGTYAYLLRSVLPQARFTAIEVWAPYVKEFGLSELYDAVHIADARVFDYGRLPTGGLAVLGDMLEHMTKVEAQQVVLSLLGRCDALLLSIPVGEWPQDEYMGNPWEAHVASYAPGEVRRVFPYSVAEITFNTGPDAGIGVFALSQRLDLQQALADCFMEAVGLIQRNNALVYCGLPDIADLSDPAVLRQFQQEVAPFLL